jgi:two-component system chemotaxis response regulator CheY
MKTVLAADDSATMRQMVGFCLKRAGFDVVEASDGRDALSKLKGRKVDLVITDLNMPNLNGIDLIKQVRLLPGYRFTPILMLTTEAQETRKKEGQAAGATGWIVKPFDPDQLLKVVKRVLPGA